MTDRVTPGAINTTIFNLEVGEVFGQFSNGWVVPSSSPTRSAKAAAVDETTFQAFDASYSSSSTNVTIQPGEAFVDGWLARDTQTTVSLSTSTTTEVYVGWNNDAIDNDEVMIGTLPDFSNDDAKVAVWEFNTDGSGVTSASDLRNIDEFRVANQHVEALQNLGNTRFFISDTEPSNWENGDIWFQPE